MTIYFDHPDPFMSPMERVQQTLDDLRPRLPFAIPTAVRVEPLYPIGGYDSLRDNRDGTLSTVDPLGRTSGRMFRDDAGRPGTFVEMNTGEIMSRGRHTFETSVALEPRVKPLMPLLPIGTCKHGEYGDCGKCSRD